MLIWIITVGEQLPHIDGNQVRLWRSVLLSNELLKKGHSVVRWSSTFDHSRKAHRFEVDTEINESANFKYIFLKGAGYKKNITIKRLIDHRIIANKFISLSKKEKKPDIILCSLPTLELSVAATKYGKENNVPVVLDARDMWPDIFEEVFPQKIRFLSKVVLYPMYQMVKKACKNATALTGISEPYIDWQLVYAGRKATKFDKYFPMAYPNTKPDEISIQLANSYWDSMNINKEDFNICLFATLENGFDIETIIESAHYLSNNNSRTKYIICGDGSNLERYKELSVGLKNILFTGWIDSSKIWTLMRKSSAGLLPYKKKSNFLLNIPNKPIEYLSAGLPLISSIEGVIGGYIKKYECGIFYDNSSSLSEKIIALEKDDLVVSKMSANAINLFRKEFIAENIYGSMADYLIAIAKSHKNAK